jgi:hypothetical protein
MPGKDSDQAQRLDRRKGADAFLIERPLQKEVWGGFASLPELWVGASFGTQQTRRPFASRKEPQA